MTQQKSLPPAKPPVAKKGSAFGRLPSAAPKPPTTAKAPSKPPTAAKAPAPSPATPRANAPRAPSRPAPAKNAPPPVAAKPAVRAVGTPVQNPKSKAASPATPARNPLPRRETMEVDMSWLEKESERPAVRKSARPADSKGAVAPPNLRGAAARRETLQVRAEWLLDSSPPAEGSPSDMAGERGDTDPRRQRSLVGPPTLPPPHANAARPRRALPPPLPREDEDEVEPTRPSRRPPKK